MNRKTWTVVAVILLVLLAAGNAPQTLELVRSAWTRVAHQAAQAGAALAVRSPVPGPALPAWAGVPRDALRLDGGHAALAGAMLLGLVAFLLAVRGVMVRWEHRGPRSTVLALARRGRSASNIARRMRLSQDAVRLLLRPEPHGARSRS